MIFFIQKKVKYLIYGIIYCSLLFSIYGCSSTTSDTIPVEVQAIFSKNCAIAGCHVTGGTAPDLSEGKSYNSLVNVKSNFVDTINNKSVKLVTPNSPETSVIVYILPDSLKDGNNNVLINRMPKNKDALSNNDQTTIGVWILNMGQNTGVGGVNAPHAPF